MKTTLNSQEHQHFLSDLKVSDHSGKLDVNQRSQEPPTFSDWCKWPTGYYLLTTDCLFVFFNSFDHSEDNQITGFWSLATEKCKASQTRHSTADWWSFRGCSSHHRTVSDLLRSILRHYTTNEHKDIGRFRLLYAALVKVWKISQIKDR